MRSAFALLAALLAACAPGSSARPEAPSRAPPPEPEPETRPFRTLSPSERVPDFRIVTTEGARLGSNELVGKTPFVVVFFATWCQVCEMKLPVVAEVIKPHRDLPVLMVSLDDADTWDRVPSFLGRFQLPRSVVRGTTYPRFSLAYDPLETVPVVAVVGRNGHLVDYQVGHSSTHGARLAAALEIAVRMPADAPPFLASPDAEPPDL